jgi:signal transduction histidine kinase
MQCFRSVRTFYAAMLVGFAVWIAVWLALPVGGLWRIATISAWLVVPAASGAVCAAVIRAKVALEAVHADVGAVVAASRSGLCLLDHGEPRYRNAAWEALVGEEPIETEGRPVIVQRHGRVVRVTVRKLSEGRALMSAYDHTELEQERAHRDRFMAEIVAAREDESRRVAELLHDDAVQRLTALGLRLELLERRTSMPELGALSADAQDIMRGLRRLMTELHPAMLESQGLVAAIEAAAEPLREQGVEVRVEPVTQRPPHELEQVAYRVVHEALANVLKHGQATRVQVTIRMAGELRCEVRDNGCGFDVASVDSALSRGSFGLHLARERIERADGRFLIQSVRGRGTSIAFELPLASPHQEQEVALA